MYKKGTAVIALIIIALRLAVLAGAADAAESWFREAASGVKLFTSGVGFEYDAVSALEPDSSGEPEEAGEEEESDIADSEAEARLPATGGGVPLPDSGADGGELPEEARTILPTTIAGGLKIENATSFEINIDELLSDGLSLRLPKEGPQILIIHTHGSEAYTPDDADMYKPSDTSRTEDKSFNVIRVGDELTSALEAFGLNVLHDREIYDYPSYTGSYTRSQAAIEAYLEQYPDIAIVIDLHRDALGTGGVVYKTVAEVADETSSQLMMLVGTGENGLYHPDWQENLKLALVLQSAVTQKYPTLARPVALKQERYNQHLTTGSLILEVGSNGNTLREALCAVRLFADAIGDTLLMLVAQE